MKSTALLLLILPISSWAKDRVLVTINGTAIREGEVKDRAFRQHGTSVLNEMVDDILLNQAAKARKVQADPAQVAARFERIQKQFPDENVFTKQLTATGLTPAALRSQLSGHVVREQLVIQARGLAVTDAEIREFFETNKARLGAPESVRLKHLLVSTEREANDFLIALRAGADFDKLAASVSIDAATKGKGGDLGLIARGMLQPEIEKTVFSLKPGEFSPPTRSPLGFHLFKVEEVQSQRPAAFKDVSADIHSALLADKIKGALPGYLQELRSQAKIVPGQP